jgi:transcriptional regulator GlxA family with amidase domain
MARTYPKVRVQPARALVATGDGQRIIMAGGGSSWQDLTLYLVARPLGIDEAMRVARVYLIDWHHVRSRRSHRMSATATRAFSRGCSAARWE